MDKRIEKVQNILKQSTRFSTSFHLNTTSQQKKQVKKGPIDYKPFLNFDDKERRSRKLEDCNVEDEETDSPKKEHN